MITNNIIFDNDNFYNDFYYSTKLYIVNKVTEIYNACLEDEVDKYIGVSKNVHYSQRNDYRNGYYTRYFDSFFGRLLISIPKTRKGGWTSSLINKFSKIDEPLTAFIQRAIFSGLSVRMAQPLIEQIVGGSFSSSRISNIIKKIDEEIIGWQKSRLDNKKYDAVFIDGIALHLWKGNQKRRPNKQSKISIVALGIKDGIREVIDFVVADGESEESTSVLLERLVNRGLKSENITLIVTDGAPGFKLAIDNYFGKEKHQRCIIHKLRNLRLALKDYPWLRKAVMDLAKDIFKTNDLEEFAEKVRKFEHEWSYLDDLKKPFLKDIDRCMTYLKKESNYKTTNHIENLFRHLRRNTRMQGHYVTEASLTRYVYGAFKMRGLIFTTKKNYTKLLT